MLRITAGEMYRFTREMFFANVRRFILANSKNEKLRDLTLDGKTLPALWTPIWDSAASLSEHDCALFLIMLAVCKCEEIALHSVEEMANQVGAREVQIKKFFEERGYFRFTDFDYPGTE